MKKSKYLAALLELMDSDTIRKSAENPNKYMSKMQIAIHYVALRKLGAL